MGGLWVNYNLMSTIPGLHVIGEANFSDHGANRLGASALMQGLADGYFIVPYTVSHYLASKELEGVGTGRAEFRAAEAAARERTERLLAIRGKRTVLDFHRELGLLCWNNCGMSRNAAGLKEALDRIPAIRAEFWENAMVSGAMDNLNQSLEYAGRVVDFLEFAELMVYDALHRAESCGGHYREEHRTEEGEALRNDDEYCYVAAWEFEGVGKQPTLHKEPLHFEEVGLARRSYK
jgi:succinate dehydrogenase / fumarate reductase flavoprotein subunit